jgi:hypothetical protein
MTWDDVVWDVAIEVELVPTDCEGRAVADAELADVAMLD